MSNRMYRYAVAVRISHGKHLGYCEVLSNHNSLERAKSACKGTVYSVYTAICPVSKGDYCHESMMERVRYAYE